MLESKDLLSSNFFHTNLVVFEIQTLIKSHSLMPGASGIGYKYMGAGPEHLEMWRIKNTTHPFVLAQN